MQLRSRALAIVASISALASAACVHDRAAPTEPTEIEGEPIKTAGTPAYVLPAGYPQPAVAPTGEMCAWMDLRYAEDPGVTPELQTLDLITPIAVLDGLVARASGKGDAPASLGRRPIVVYIHGGTWSAGGKRGGLEQKAPRLVGAGGFLLASINYRLAPTWKHPAQVEDTASALAWLHAHAAQFGGAPDHFVLVGSSAGAHLAALVATDERYLGKHGLPLSLIAGVVSLDGASFDLATRSAGDELAQSVIASVFGDDRAAWADASPFAHVAPGKGIAPFLLFQATTGDATHLEVSQQQTSEFVEKLKAAGVRVDFVQAGGKSHKTISRDLGAAGDPVTTRLLEFATEVTKQEGTR
jgi:acetyl esterase/lipase